MPAAAPVRRRSALLAGLAAFVIAASGVFVAPREAAAGTLGSLVELGLDAASSRAGLAFVHAATGTSALPTGKDGRVTVLLIGSDHRETLSGERTDIVLVITINPKTKQMAAVSIPRDVARLPINKRSTFKGKVNTIFSAYRGKLGRDGALDKMRDIVAYTLAIEIDYYVMIRMTAFNVLTDRVGGYKVSIPTAIKDPSFWDDPDGPRGIYFPAATSRTLKGNLTTLCNGYFFTKLTNKLAKPGAQCDRAIVYVRTRKGKGNSDFKRQGRAQDVVGAAITRVTNRNNGKELRALFNAAVGQANNDAIDTDIPMTFETALDFYALLKGAKLTQRQVFTPTTYASKISGTSSYQLKLKAVRALTRKWFAPVN